MRLPSEPKPLDILGARFDAALQTIIRQEAVDTGAQLPPGMCRSNVFDFEDSFRLIVSRDQGYKSDEVFLHCSWSGDETLMRSIADKLRARRVREAKQEIGGVVIERLRSMGVDGSALVCVHVMFSARGVPHCFFKDPGPSVPKCKSTTSVAKDEEVSTCRPSSAQKATTPN